MAAAAQIGGDVVVLVAGAGCEAAAKAAAAVAGVKKVLVADAAQYKDGLPEDLAALIVSLAPNYSHILAPATAFGKTVTPRVAALLDVAQISEIIEVVSPDTFVRPIYAGNAYATVQSKDKIKVITVRATGFDAVAATGGSAPRSRRSPPAPADRSSTLQGPRHRQAGASRTHRRQGHRLRRTRHGFLRGLPQVL